MYFDDVIYYGFIIHVVFILSIFDIYFKSPIVSGINPVHSIDHNISSRVVLISADGLRLDSVFDKYPDDGGYVAPFLRSVIEQKASWGMSESHLPTESRPGHVAMIAGFYEDPSAVTRGWKHNPVDFDSLFNTSRCTFAWGSPDIVLMFSQSIPEKKCVYTDTYDASEQRFAGTTTEYDNWVHAKVVDFLEKSFSNHNNSVREKGTLFFLHLLGQDTAGHTYKPHTTQYKMNLENVDKLVQKFENLFEQYYRDSKTTFIVTSDHGMTDWGSHGSGDPAETRTPFIAWGAGIQGPEKSYSEVSLPWGLSHLKMKNLEQADITPLIATLLSVPIPVNSVGKLPVSYLNVSQEVLSKSLLTNTVQMFSHLKRKEDLIRTQIFPIFYSEMEDVSDEKVRKRIEDINININNKNFELALSKCEDLLKLCLKGLDYYHYYYQRILLFTITSSYILWTVILLLKISCNINLIPFKHIVMVSDYTYLSMLLIITCLIYLQQLPLMFMLYLNLPVYFMWILHNNKFKIYSFLKRFKSIKNLSTYFFFYIIAVELLVLNFFDRWVLSLCVLLMICSLFYLVRHKAPPIVLSFWIVSGICVSIFPLLPVIGKKPKINQVLTSGILWIMFAFLVTLLCFHKLRRNVVVPVVSIVSLVVTIWNIYMINQYFNVYNELSVQHQFLSIVLWCVSTFIPFFCSKHVISRLFVIVLSLAVPFLLMTVNHEGFFLLALIINLFCWLYLEYLNSDVSNFDKDLFDYTFEKFIDTSDTNSMNNYRIAYFFLTYVFLGFFGIGNIASLNSFDPVWVRCFITTFSPFTMAALILFKTVIPFLIIICILRGITNVMRIDVQIIFIIVLIFCNIMGVNFLFLVTNQGSWLDIGTSISHYVIQQTTVLFLVFLYKVANFLTNFSMNFPRNITKIFTNNCNQTLPQVCQQVKND